MWSDVVELRDFYASPLGQTAQQMLRQAIRRAWPAVQRQRIAGYGFPTPYLGPFLGEAQTLIALMPAPQGVIAWPTEGANRACLVEEEVFPLPDLSLDRLVMVHALEHATQPQTLLREAWRVLDAEGRLLLVVPNRRGLWARIDRTPFGWGRPFSRAQMTDLLNDMLFEKLSTDPALFLPPTKRQWLQRSAPFWESLAVRWCPRFGGVLLIEARKRLMAPGLATPALKRQRVVPVLPSLTRRGGGRAPAPIKGHSDSPSSSRSRAR